MINTVATIMEGRPIDAGKIPYHARAVYKQQAQIGWRNIIMGKLSWRWSEVRTVDDKGRYEKKQRWRTRAIGIILE